MATQHLPRSGAHPFYTRLNQSLDKADFDGYVDSPCEGFYAMRSGVLAYRRMLLLGYFERLDSDREIAWRSLSRSVCGAFSASSSTRRRRIVRRSRARGGLGTPVAHLYETGGMPRCTCAGTPTSGSGC